jgi:hypothetical protein
VTDYTLYDRRSIAGMRTDCFLLSSRPAVGHTQPRILYVSGNLSLVAKWPKRDADLSSPYIAEIMNTWSSALPIRHHGILLRHRNIVTVTNK